ncbi:MAG: hypothetical protein Q8920_02010 [Bacillota bacterium]|nr:hypothetical protein [Bacillota bacterium]
MNGNTRKIVVIKDIPSNFIEEAILILKTDPAPSGDNTQAVEIKKGKKKDNEFLLKEAESIINNYICECKNRGINIIDPTKRPNKLKRKFITNVVINIVLICSVAFLIFVLSRLF